MYKIEDYNFKCLHYYKECKFNKHEKKQAGKLHKKMSSGKEEK